jgi:hypothetical protein
MMAKDGPRSTLTISIYNGYWFWGPPVDCRRRHDLRALTSEIRPDWDLSTPGLREAWNAGDLPSTGGACLRSSVQCAALGI